MRRPDNSECRYTISETALALRANSLLGEILRRFNSACAQDAGHIEVNQVIIVR